jgi:hypothetical protein
MQLKDQDYFASLTDLALSEPFEIINEYSESTPVHLFIKPLP